MTETNGWCKVDNAFEHQFPLVRFTEIDKSYSFIIDKSGKSSWISEMYFRRTKVSPF